MNGFINDLRFGLRQLAAKPGFAAAGILTLSLGIGANTAVFSFLSGYLLKPLPYPNPTQLVQVNVLLPKLDVGPHGISLPLYKVVKEKTDAFAATAFYIQGTSTIAVEGRAKHVLSIYASGSLFHVLGVQPMLGRVFTNANMRTGNRNVAIISYDLWRDSFGADRRIVGKRVWFDDGIRRIVGVMPDGFAFPEPTEAVWLPYPTTPDAFDVAGWDGVFNHFIGRLKPGVNLDTAEKQVQHAVSIYIRDNVPAKSRKVSRAEGFTMAIRPWRSALFGDRLATLLLLQGAVALILLMTCVNVANLLLSRILGRNHELATRSALGATRAALARQLLGEALCLTLPGGLAGVALAWLAVHFWTSLSLGAGESIFNITLDWRVALFALGIALFAALIVSVLPIRHLTKTDVQLVLQQHSRTGGGRSARHTRNMLVVAQLTLATGLLAIAGLLLHSFMNLETVDPGYRKDHVLMASLLVPRKDHPGTAALSSFYTDLIRRVNALPGVRQAATAHAVPLGGLNKSSFDIIGQVPPVSGRPVAMFNYISRGYFKAFAIPILRGRAFDSQGAGEMAAIVDIGLARKYFRGADPIGQQIKINGKKYAIIGIVPSIKYADLSQSSASTTIYLDKDQDPYRFTGLVIHTALPPGSLIKPLKDLVASMDSKVSVYDVHTMQEQLAGSLRQRQTTMTLLLAFGGIALALAIIGVYAVMSYAVGQRRAECGVRLALGAQPEDLSWLVLKDGIKLLAIGLVAGLGLAVLFGYLLASQLFGVTPFDPVTLIGSGVVLCGVTLAACYLPARRAAKLDPAIAMMEQ